MKNSHMDQYISVEKMINALNTFKELQNKHYNNINIPESYEDFVRTEDPIGYDLIYSEEENSMEDILDNNTEENVEEMNDDESLKEDEKYYTEDPIQKWKFNFDEKTTYVNDYPEMDVFEEIPTREERSDDPVKVAPGEGKRPENILKSEDWDTSSFPSLHPDGKNGLHEERKYKLTDPEYFQQRILNHDRRFANSTEYVFASYAYLEQRRLESNINISFMRGKSNAQGQYSLDDAYSVLENAPGTPRYWQKKRHELIGKLENLGPFQLFFTLSCAEKNGMKTLQLSFKIIK